MPTASPRIIAIDAARGFAVIGMFIAHVIPRENSGELLVDGRSSILFATLAGVSLGLVTGGATPATPERRRLARTSIALRAAILFVLGVLLSTLNSGIAIILDYYAVMFLLLLPFLFASISTCVIAAATLAIAAPLFASAVPVDLAEDGLPGILSLYLLTGYYPAVIWLPFLLAGLVAARSGLEQRMTQLALAGGGLVLAAVGYLLPTVIPGVTAEAHSSSTAEVLGSGGTALMVIGILLLVLTPGRPTRGMAERATTTTGHARRLAEVLLAPVTAVGSMALTIYTAQIVVLAGARLIDEGGGPVDYPGWELLFWLIGGAMVFAVLWRRWLGKGPLERALHVLSHPRPRPARQGVP